jgi:hypothetical protein
MVDERPPTTVFRLLSAGHSGPQSHRARFAPDDRGTAATRPNSGNPNPLPQSPHGAVPQGFSIDGEPRRPGGMELDFGRAEIL